MADREQFGDTDSYLAHLRASNAAKRGWETRRRRESWRYNLKASIRDIAEEVLQSLLERRYPAVTRGDEE